MKLLYIAVGKILVNEGGHGPLEFCASAEVCKTIIFRAFSAAIQAKSSMASAGSVPVIYSSFLSVVHCRVQSG